MMRDENFLNESDKIRAQFEELIRASDAEFFAFLRRYGMITPLNAEEALRKALETANGTTRRALENYIEYALRFCMCVRLRRRKLRDEWIWRVEFYAMPRPMCNRMKAKIGEHIYPDVEGRFIQGEECWPYFNAPDLHLSDDVKQRLEKSKARIVQMRDDLDYGNVINILRELEAWFYDPNSLTFLVHGRNPPVLLCLVGENVEKKPWRDTDTLITALQREYFHRKQGGRKKDRAQHAAVEKQALLPGPQKDKLSSLGYHGAQSSQQSSLSRARTESRKRKKP